MSKFGFDSGLRSAPRVISVLAALAVTASAVAAEVPWRSGNAELAAQTPTAKAALLEQVQNRDNAPQHFVVQLAGSADAKLRSQLASQGLTLLGYVGANAYYASVDPQKADIALLADSPAVAAIDDVRLEWKLHPDYLDGIAHPWAVGTPTPDGQATIAAYVLFHRDVNLASDGRALLKQYGAFIRSEIPAIHGAVVELPADLLEALATEDSVQWIEPPLPKMSEINAENRWRTGADIVQEPPYNLDGSGVTVLVYDGGYCRASHVDFQGRLTVYDSSGLSDHSTHVAGTIGGAGVANSSYRGMAPGVELVSYGFEQPGGLQPGFLYTDPGDLAQDYGQAITVHDADISNNSIGTNTATNGYPCEWTGDYNVTSNLIDTVVRGDGSSFPFAAPFRVVWANGNERQTSRCGSTYQTTAPPACAKNHITVGALVAEDDTMSSFSSWGPADDGRMKPDISAPGVDVTSCSSSSDTAYTTKSGTSMASPTVCGCSALLLEDYRAQYPGEPDFRNSTLKVILAHTAVDRGNAGPDYQFGYGSIRIQPAVDLMRAGNFMEAEVDQGTVHSVIVSVDPDDTEMKVTIAWDDYPAAPAVTAALVNDLDLHVYSPSNVRHYPWTLGGTANPSAPAVQTQENHLDNIEQVFVANPEPGAWRIEIHGTNVPHGPQPVSIAATPLLVSCSSTGLVALGAPNYACEDVLDLQVVDCDLNTDDGVIEQVMINVSSDTEPAGETVTLIETAGETADFRGVLPISETDAVGVLQIGPDDTITATYIDEDDGQGGTNVIVTATATLDCVGPIISNVTVESVGSDNATITFQTDEPAVGTIWYGLSCDALTDSVTADATTTDHSIRVSGLAFNTAYFFAVEAADAQGNIGSDDNGGDCYGFSTPNVVYNFPLNANPGWTTAGQWAFGQPLGGGSNNGDPDSAYTGTNVYGYNLSGDYPDNLPATYLTTTPIDFTGMSDVSMSFWRWLGVESNSNFDEATIEISNDGSNWTVLWRATATGGDILDSAWTYQEFDISDYADDQASVHIRWGMGPTDGGLTMPGWNIDDIQFVAVGGSLAIGLPDGAPEYLTPGTPTTFTVRIIEGDEQLIPDTAMLNYRYDGGSYNSVPLTAVGGEYYEATLPAAGCNATPEFYLSAEGTQSGFITRPATAPSSVYTADVGVFVVLFEDDFETNQGWTVQNSAGLEDGPWGRGDPVNCNRGDPPTDFDGSGQCYLTDNSSANGCNSDVDGGYTWLRSPTLDLDGADAVVQFALWYTNNFGDDPNNDLFVIDVSNNNGASWTEVEVVGPNSAAGWSLHTFRVSDYVTPTDSVVVRFEASDLAGGSVVEAGIDAFRVETFICEQTITPGDMNCDGVISAADIDGFVVALTQGQSGYDALYPDCEFLNADTNDDGLVSAADIDSFVALLTSGK
jgi:hypothetical protein